MTAYSPLHRPLDCPVSCTDGVYSAKFQPDEVGEWKIHVTYEGQHIQGSPFNCFVYDPHAVRVGGAATGCVRWWPGWRDWDILFLDYAEEKKLAIESVFNYLSPFHETFVITGLVYCFFIRLSFPLISKT